MVSIRDQNPQNSCSHLKQGQISVVEVVVVHAVCVVDVNIGDLGVSIACRDRSNLKQRLTSEAQTEHQTVEIVFISVALKGHAALRFWLTSALAHEKQNLSQHLSSTLTRAN